MTSVSEFYGDSHIGLRFGVHNASHTTPLGHSGQDINGWKEGTWIPHFGAGTVVRKIANHSDLGNFIVIRTKLGGIQYYVTHCHLSNFGGTPEVGDGIAFGQGVGPIGNTGYSKGTHDHIMMSQTSMFPETKVRLLDPLPFILQARTDTSGGGVTPFPPTPETRKVNPVLSICFSYRSGVGQFLMYVSSTRVSLTPELSGMTAANKASQVNTALAIAKAVGLPYTTEAQIPVLDDSPNGGWYLRNQLALAAASMPSTFALSPSNPYVMPASGALTPTQDAALMDIPSAVELTQALTSTVSLVNAQAAINRDQILDAIDEIPAGSSSAGAYSLSLEIEGVPGTASGTATPTA